MMKLFEKSKKGNEKLLIVKSCLSIRLWSRSLCLIQHDFDFFKRHLCEFTKPNQGSGKLKEVHVCQFSSVRFIYDMVILESSCKISIV
jgi:hypothetical protein